MIGRSVLILAGKFQAGSRVVGKIVSKDPANQNVMYVKNVHVSLYLVTEVEKKSDNGDGSICVI